MGKAVQGSFRPLMGAAVLPRIGHQQHRGHLPGRQPPGEGIHARRAPAIGQAASKHNARILRQIGQGRILFHQHGKQRPRRAIAAGKVAVQVLRCLLFGKQGAAQQRIITLGSPAVQAGLGQLVRPGAQLQGGGEAQPLAGQLCHAGAEALVLLKQAGGAFHRRCRRAIAHQQHIRFARPCARAGSINHGLRHIAARDAKQHHHALHPYTSAVKKARKAALRA